MILREHLDTEAHRMRAKLPGLVVWLSDVWIHGDGQADTCQGDPRRETWPEEDHSTGDGQANWEEYLGVLDSFLFLKVFQEGYVSFLGGGEGAWI